MSIASRIPARYMPNYWSHNTERRPMLRPLGVGSASQSQAVYQWVIFTIFLPCCLVTQLTFCLYDFLGNRARRLTESKSNFSCWKTRVLLTLQSQIASYWEVPCTQHSGQSDPFKCMTSVLVFCTPCSGSPVHLKYICLQALCELVPYNFSDPFCLLLFPCSSALIALILALMCQACFPLRAIVLALPHGWNMLTPDIHPADSSNLCLNVTVLTNCILARI